MSLPGVDEDPVKLAAGLVGFMSASSPPATCGDVTVCPTGDRRHLAEPCS